MRIVIFVLGLAVSAGPAPLMAKPMGRRARRCRHLLSSPPATGLVAEPGSVEDRTPGTARELKRLMARIEALRDSGRAGEKSSWPAGLPVIAADLSSLAQVGDRRLAEMITPVLDRLGRLHRRWRGGATNVGAVADELTHIRANLFEVLVASLFSGRRIQVNASVRELFPTSRDPREIDVAIERGDGSWRVIEVKDWRTRVAQAPHMQAKVFKQASGLRAALEQTGARVQLDLVMRYGLRPEVVDTYREGTGYDHILFIYGDEASEDWAPVTSLDTSVIKVRHGRYARSL